MAEEISQEDRAALDQLREAMANYSGPPFSIRSIAKIAGVSPATVLRDLRANDPNYDGDQEGAIEVGKAVGLDGRIRPSRRYDTTERDARIRALREEGKLIRTIAEEVGVSIGTVHRVIKQATSISASSGLLSPETDVRERDRHA